MRNWGLVLGTALAYAGAVAVGAVMFHAATGGVTAVDFVHATVAYLAGMALLLLLGPGGDE